MADSNHMSVSVVVAAYNAVPFIGRALASALVETDVPIEILVVDDASTDGTPQFVRDHFGSDARVRLIGLPENAGPAAARNAGLEQARGKWIAVLDADDAFEPGHLRDLVALGEAENADIVSGNFAYFDAHQAKTLQPGLDVRSGIARLDRYAYAGGARPYTGEADFGLLKPMFSAAFLRRHALRYPIDVRHGEDMELVL